MFAPPNPAQREAILALIARTPEGVALDRIAQSLTPPPDDRRLKQWLDDFADEGLVFTLTADHNAPYLAADPVGLLKAITASRGKPSACAAPVSVTDPQPAASAAPLPAVSAAAAVPSAPTPSPGDAGLAGGQSEAPPAAVAPAVSANTPAVAAEVTASPPAASPPAPFDPEFPKMIELAIPTIVSSPTPRSTVIARMRTQAARNGKVGRGIGAYVNYALARFDALTVADVQDYAITAEEFTAWRRVYAPPPPPEPKPAASTTPAAVLPSAAAPASPAPRVLVAPDLSDDVAPSVEPRAAPPPKPDAELDPFSAEGLLQALQHSRSDAYKKRAFAVIKALLTVNRIGIALAIAIVIRFMALQLRELNSFLPLLAYPAAGLPWVYFRWLDETEEKPLTGREAIVVLVAGGVVSVFVAGGVVSMIYMLRNAAV